MPVIEVLLRKVVIFVFNKALPRDCLQLRDAC